MSSGREVIYVAVGRKYQDEAVASAKSVRANTRNVAITVFTDDTRMSETDLFNNVHYVQPQEHMFSLKIACIARASAAHCLFLDTDTLVCGDIDSMFQVLSRFDLAACHASWRFSPALNGSEIVQSEFIDERVPSSVVDFNTGVIAFRTCPETSRFFGAWREEYERQLADATFRPGNEQAAFRIALWQSRLQTYVFPPEFNYRCDFPGAIGGKLRIVHGRHPRIQEIADILGSRSGARAFDPGTWQLLTSRYLNAKPS
jgi:hypothetical protein